MDEIKMLKIAYSAMMRSIIAHQRKIIEIEALKARFGEKAIVYSSTIDSLRRASATECEYKRAIENLETDRQAAEVIETRLRTLLGN